MKIHVIVRSKPTTVSIDDILFDYFGAWLLDASPKLHSNAKEHHSTAKDYVKKLCATLDLPDKNVSQFIQGKILEIVAAPHLAAILETRGPRYEPPKKETYEERPPPSSEDKAKGDQLMRLMMASEGRKSA